MVYLFLEFSQLLLVLDHQLLKNVGLVERFLKQ